MVVTGDTAVITVKLADVNGGGVSGQSVVLAVEDTINNGVTIEEVQMLNLMKMVMLFLQSD